MDDFFEVGDDVTRLVTAITEMTDSPVTQEVRVFGTPYTVTVGMSVVDRLFGLYSERIYEMEVLANDELVLKQRLDVAVVEGMTTQRELSRLVTRIQDMLLKAHRKRLSERPTIED